MHQSREALKDLILKFGHERKDQPFQLSSGEFSYDYVDGKRAISHGDGLTLVAEEILRECAERGIDFDAVGGLTMGADPIAHAVAVVGRKRWFSVRKEPKGHGTQRLTEGAQIGPGTKVVVVDDVVTTGASILRALDAVTEIGCEIVMASTLVDRGDVAAEAIASRNIVYVPLLTYRDLDIDPVDGRVSA